MTSACNAVASICRAPLRTISSSSDELAVFSLDASASWTTLSISAPSRTSAPTPVLIRVLWQGDLPREGALLHGTRPEGDPQVLIIALRSLAGAPAFSGAP